jgi:hypothetical protein
LYGTHADDSIGRPQVQLENANKDKQIKILTDQNSELLRLLETEEAQTAKLSAENESFRKELEALKLKYGALLTTAKTHEEMAARAAREGQLRAEEVRPNEASYVDH